MAQCRDIFQKHNLSVPNTWEDLAALAKKMNGTDLDGDGQGDYSLCIRTGPQCTLNIFFAQIMASITQVGGKQSGAFFTIPDMQPMVVSACLF